MATILIADDEAKMRKILTLALMEDGHETLEAGTAPEAIHLINTTSLSLAITDLRMPGGGGMAVLEAVKKVNHYLPVIILTAYGTIENAVDALKRGAHDYLLKPCDLEELKLTVRKALQVHHLELENYYLRHELDERLGGGELAGQSASMMSVLESIRRVARGEGTVLIRGESGTGKELAARAIHKQGPRAKNPFVSVNCSSMPADLLELELFGRARNTGGSPSTPAAGKFELARNGILFLDEIGGIPARLQGRILHAIEEQSIQPVGGDRPKKINARIIASTNTDLEEKVRKNEFRSDLYFRLNVLPIQMPPLRERKEDIPLLIRHFVKKKSRGREPVSFSSEQIEILRRYHWPGNVRELENVVERALVLGVTDPAVLIPSLHPPMSPEAQMARPQREFLSLSYKDAKKSVLDQFENHYFSNLLKKTHGNISRAAEAAQIHRKNLHVKLGELGIDPRQFSQPGSPREESEED